MQLELSLLPAASSALQRLLPFQLLAQVLTEGGSNQGTCTECANERSTEAVRPDARPA